MSSLFGNFVTLSDITDEEIDYIDSMHVTPLYVSLHTSDEVLRRELLGKKDARPIIPVLKKLSSCGCEIHLQIVICPGINDGNILINSIQDSWDLGESIRSLGIVPVGLTEHRDRLYSLEQVNPSQAEEIIEIVEEWQKKANEKRGYPWIYAADEFFLKAGRNIPELDYYDCFPQVENGIGISALAIDEIDQIVKYIKANGIKRESVHKLESASSDEGVSNFNIPDNVTKAVIIVGESAADVIKEPLKKLFNVTELNCEILTVENKLFGSSVTVTGLLAGGDVLSAIKGREINKDASQAVYFIHDVCLDEEKRFLDDMTLQQLQKEICCQIISVSSFGEMMQILGYTSGPEDDGSDFEEADWEYCWSDEGSENP